MPPTHVVVDGSNIATEGRSTPSLQQLDQAVRQYMEEHPGVDVTVVVDASFGHRIDRSEHHAFEEAVSHGELISPPAGAIGRGDAFVLRIAERLGAQVLSNDSFREFLEEHPWLFEEGRLMGATPVPGVGWIFSPRRPVRGPLPPDGPARKRRTSSQAAKERVVASRSGPSAKKTAKQALPAKEKKPAKTAPVGAEAPAGGVKDAAIAQATEEALGSPRRSGRGSQKKQKPTSAPEAVNDPLSFITFASDHPVGSEMQGTVVSFTSHGAMAQVDSMLCYVPLAGLGDPPPRRARDVLKLGEVRTFRLVALDPSRRGAQLALSEVGAASGLIAEEAEQAASEVRRRRKTEDSAARRPPAKRPAKAAATKAALSEAAAPLVTPTKAAPKKAASKRPAKKAPVTQAPSKAVPPRKKAAATAPVAKKASIAPTKAAKAAKPATKKAQKAPAKAAARKAPAKKQPATKTVAPAGKKAAKKATPAKKATTASKTSKPATAKKASPTPTKKKVVAAKQPVRVQKKVSATEKGARKR